MTATPKIVDMDSLPDPCASRRAPRKRPFPRLLSYSSSTSSAAWSAAPFVRAQHATCWARSIETGCFGATSGAMPPPGIYSSSVQVCDPLPANKALRDSMRILKRLLRPATERRSHAGRKLDAPPRGRQRRMASGRTVSVASSLPICLDRPSASSPSAMAAVSPRKARTPSSPAIVRATTRLQLHALAYNPATSCAPWRRPMPWSSAPTSLREKLVEIGAKIDHAARSPSPVTCRRHHVSGRLRPKPCPA